MTSYRLGKVVIRVIRQLPSAILNWCGVATHVHTNFPQNPTCQGSLTAVEAIDMAAQLGFGGIAFAEHTSDPGAPSATLNPTLIDALVQQTRAVDLETERAFHLYEDFGIWSGVEANIMPNGTLDVPSSRLDQIVRYVLASQHGGLGDEEKDANAIARRLTLVCHDPHVTAIGHPTRYNDEVSVNWPTILEMAAFTNTMVEMNLNLWFSKGPGRGREAVNNPGWYRSQVAFWRTWMKAVADSGAPVVIGLDAHHLSMWPLEEQTDPKGTTSTNLLTFVGLIQEAGIRREQVVNHSAGSFTEWLTTPKLDRASLVTW